MTQYSSTYFESGNYGDRRLGRFSMYWFARRYYAALCRRYAPAGDATRRLVELGTGLGDLVALLDPHFECTGIDASQFCVDETRSRAPSCDVVLGDEHTLEAFDDRSIDVAVSLHVVEHLHDPAATIGEFGRVVRPSGLLMFATPNPDYRLRRLKDPANDAIRKDPTHINVQPRAQWRAWCDAAGFSVTRHFGDGLWDVPYISHIPSSVQLAVVGLPGLAQVMTRTTFNPVAAGVNQVLICHRTGGGNRRGLR